MSGAFLTQRTGVLSLLEVWDAEGRPKSRRGAGQGAACSAQHRCAGSRRAVVSVGCQRAPGLNGEIPLIQPCWLEGRSMPCPLCPPTYTPKHQWQ